MGKIKLFEDYFNEGIKKFEDFAKPEQNEDADHHGTLSPDDDLDIELEPEDDDDDSLEEKADPLSVTSKDVMRINDIREKANGNMDKMKKLAETMCKLITDKMKAVRRARAAERAGEEELANIFYARAQKLGAFGG